MGKIPDKGLSEAELWAKLDGFRRDDADWRRGRIFAYFFIVSEEVRRVAERAYLTEFWENAIDPTLFPSIKDLEKEVVSIAGAHLNGEADVVGNFTSGGTESITLAVKAARDWARARRPGLSAPEMVLPVTAHAAFFKAAHYLGIKPIVTGVDPRTFQADVNAIRDALSENTVLIAASAPSYSCGVIDPIAAIGELALERGIFFHVDACMGGFILPFFKRLGAEVQAFDFSVPGVCSISMDFHKYAFTPKGASVVLYRNKELRRHQLFACSDWTGYPLVYRTLQGSRSGGAVVATWAVLHHMGDQGYLEVARKLKEATDKVIAGVAAIPGLYIMGKPVMCLLALSSNTINIFRLADELTFRDWHIQAQLKRGPIPASIHLTILPPNTDHIDEWLVDLKECAAIAGTTTESPLVQEVIKRLDGLEAVSDAQMGMFMQTLGIGGGQIPKGTAEMNEILNVLPPGIVNQFMIAYFNEHG